LLFFVALLIFGLAFAIVIVVRGIIYNRPLDLEIFSLKPDLDRKEILQEVNKSFVMVDITSDLNKISDKEKMLRIVSAIEKDYLPMKDLLKTFPKDLKQLGLYQGNTDWIVIYKKGGKPILPDLQKATKTSKIGDPKNKLAFTFDSPANPWSLKEKEYLKRHLESAYVTARTIAGPPAFDIVVNVQKITNDCGCNGMYSPSENTIYIKEQVGIPSDIALAMYLDVSTHEMVHAFRDDAMFSVQSLEEGFAESISTEVDLNPKTWPQPSAEPNRNHILNSWYENQNKEQLATIGGYFGSNPALRIIRYLSVGFIWSKVLVEHPSFYTSFHRSYYDALVSDPGISGNKDRLLELAKRFAPNVEGVVFDDWVKRQNVMNTKTDRGTKIYSFFAGLGDYNVLVALVYTNYEQPLGGIPLTYKCDPFFLLKPTVEKTTPSIGLPIEGACSGTMTTNEQGLAYYIFPKGFSKKIPTKITVSTAGNLEDETVGFSEPLPGVFGVLKDQFEIGKRIVAESSQSCLGGRMVVGEISPSGAFNFPILVSGRCRIDLEYKDSQTGKVVVSKSITKDASPYFVDMRK
jgi:hypothetical protein